MVKSYGKIKVRLRPGISLWKTIIQKFVIPGNSEEILQNLPLGYWDHRGYANTCTACIYASHVWSTCMIPIFISLFPVKSLTLLFIHEPTCNTRNNTTYLYNSEIFIWRYPRDQLIAFSTHFNVTKTGLAWLKTTRLCNRLAPLLLKHRMLSYMRGRMILSSNLSN